jgi:hypothetical protein
LLWCNASTTSRQAQLRNWMGRPLFSFRT